MESPKNNSLDVVRGRDQEIGPLLGIFIILMILVVGAFYFWSYELRGNSRSPLTGTTTEVIIYRHPITATSTNTTTTSTGNPRAVRAEQSSHEGNPRAVRAEQSSHEGNPRAVRAEQSSHEGNAELDAIENGLESQTQNVNGLSF